ncbi:MAG: hypothetical protein PHV82_18245, partial [Victivallaceae bacterium]|nr:hypothetical protein [Victivallaceae bacterium]
FCAGLLFLFLISPWLLYEYRHTGWPVTELRQAVVLDRLFGRKTPQVCPVKVALSTSVRQLQVIDKVAEQEKDGYFIENLVKGFYPQYLIFILPVLIFRICRRKMSADELILLLMVFVHALGMVGQIAVADKKLFIYKRYLIVAAPLLFGWGAVGARWSYDKLRRSMTFRYRWVCTLIIFIVITGLIFDGWSRVRKKQLNPYLYEQVKTHIGVELRK